MTPIDTWSKSMSGLRPGSSRHAKAVRGLGRLLSLYRSAGRAEHREDGVHSTGQSMEQLEARILLGGDHPSFDLPLDAMSGTEIVIDGVTGEGDEDGIIEDVTPDLSDDLFRFVAPQDDFVTVWADTINGGGSTLDSRVEVYGIDGTLISAGSSQGQLTEGFFDDGWTSFIAEAGETYFVVVRSDVDNAGQLSTGMVRFNAKADVWALGILLAEAILLAVALPEELCSSIELGVQVRVQVAGHLGSRCRLQADRASHPECGGAGRDQRRRALPRRAC